MGAFPALDVKAPQTDWLGEAGKLVSLKALMQAAPVEQAQREENLRASKNENAEKEYQMGGRSAMNQAYKNAVKVDENGTPTFDTNELSKSLSAAGYGSEIPGVLKGITDFNKSNADLQEARQKIDVSSRDAMGAAAYAIKKSNYDPGLADAVLQHGLQDPTIGAQQKQQLTQLRQLLQSPQGAQMLPKLVEGMISQSPKYQELSTSEAKEQNSADTLKLENRKLDLTLPGGPLEDVSKTELRDYLKNPKIDAGTPLASRDGATFAAWKAKLNPLAQLSVANTAGGKLTDAAMDNAAEIYWQTGKLPPTARGLIGLAQNKQVMNRASQLHAGDDITSDQGAYAANKKALADLQDQYSKVEAFSDTAKKNLQLFLEQAKKVIDTGSPLINKPLRGLTKAVVGGNMVPYETARTTAYNEITRVLNTANASGGALTDSAKAEGSALLGKDFTLKNAYDAANIIFKDMDNRKTSYAAQINDLTKRLGGKKTPEAPAAPSKPDWDKYPEVK